MKKKVGVIIQARMGSTRLPGKVVKSILGKPMLARMIERVKSCSFVDKIIIATTDKQEDNPICEVAKNEKISFFRGDEHDVLKRISDAALAYEVDIIVRMTGDCPLIDPQISDNVIQKYLQENYDYVATDFRYPRGLDTEVVSSKLLQKISNLALKKEEREHVTLYLYEHPQTYLVARLPYPSLLEPSQVRLCVDTEEDFQLVSAVFEALYPQNPQFSFSDVLSFLNENPEICKINDHIQQKKVR